MMPDPMTCGIAESTPSTCRTGSEIYTFYAFLWGRYRGVFSDLILDVLRNKEAEDEAHPKEIWS